MPVIAQVAEKNVILSISGVTGSFFLERKIGFSGTWMQWDGSAWVAAPGGVLQNNTNFTDYNLSEGIYQYRYVLDGETEYSYSNCVAIGENPVGWTFENYEIPEGQWGEVLTADDLRYSYLWGVAFTATDGTAWTDAQTRKSVEWAVYQLEKKLNLTIFERLVYSDDDNSSEITESKFVEKEFPYSAKRKRNWLVRLKRRPVQEVTRFEWFSPVDQKIMNLKEWERLNRKTGELWFYPKSGAGLSYIGYAYPWNMILNGANYVQAFHVDYKAGFKNAELIPEDLRDVVGKIAALKMLNVIGDGLIAGFSSSSLSLDGMSESFSSTQSATSAFFGARIKVYQDEIKEYIAENKNKYGNFIIGSI